ncbi:MAG: hypothetical protein LUC60_10085 [Lachnospiraceae bacterium]|nr:hypothetical protein [Lachnospiraceae bacterium]
MNGYTLSAKAYKQLLEQRPDLSDADKANILKTIKSLELMAEMSDEDRNDLFDTGAFNDISYGYFKTALKRCDVDRDTMANILSEFRYLLDVMSAAAARDAV